MKLTNKQQSIIVDMIYNNIYNEEYKSKLAKEKEAFIQLHLKKFKASALHKQIVSALNNKLIIGVRVYDKDLYPSIGLESPYSYSSVSTTYFDGLKEAYNKVEYISMDQFKETNKITRGDIEREVIMSMLSAKDIQSLINSITLSLRK